MKRAAILAASLLLAGKTTAATLDPFFAAFGERGIEVLSLRGYLVLQGRRGERRLNAVHWKALEALALAAPSCLKLSVPATDGPETGLAACRALPLDGAMTPRLHFLAAAIAAAHEENWALVSSSAPLTEPEGLENLFETPWGRELARRHRADALEDPQPLVKTFFEETLSRAAADAPETNHFLAVASARGASGLGAVLAADTARGVACEALRSWIRLYLLEERRRWGLMRAQERIKALRSDKQASGELSDLAELSLAFSSKPGLIASLEASLSNSPAPSGEPHLLSAGLHLQERPQRGRHELGDVAVVSGGYWVDGLEEGAAVDVEETTFIETSRGFSQVQSRVEKRRNGGPYAFARREEIEETHPFAWRAIISAASGSVIDERVEVPVDADYALAVGKEADALEQALSCSPKSAAAADAALESLLTPEASSGDTAKTKPQYKALLDRTRKDRAKNEAEAAALSELESAALASREDLSTQACRYDASRTDAAIRLARRLPAGCDRVLPSLFAQRAAISRRLADQDWFAKASSEARDRRNACDFKTAAERWTQALAVLDSDPAARCGKTSEEAAQVESELGEALRAMAWNDSLEKAVAKAEAETLPTKRLTAVRPALARLVSLEDRKCRRDLLKRAEKIAAQAGEEDSGSSEVDMLRRLPREEATPPEVEEVRRARARLLEKSEDASRPPEAPAKAPSALEPPAPPAAAKTKNSSAKTKSSPAKPKRRKKTPAKRKPSP